MPAFSASVSRHLSGRSPVVPALAVVVVVAVALAELTAVGKGRIDRRWETVEGLPPCGERAAGAVEAAAGDWAPVLMSRAPPCWASGWAGLRNSSIFTTEDCFCCCCCCWMLVFEDSFNGRCRWGLWPGW
uniref:(northern house mosquito) hypothetical protein n=1 Tax=Culex pipiens TaxID=7175 RepID=A0A8D8BR72_CULPI